MSTITIELSHTLSEHVILVLFNYDILLYKNFSFLLCLFIIPL